MIVPTIRGPERVDLTGFPSSRGQTRQHLGGFSPARHHEAILPYSSDGGKEGLLEGRRRRRKKRGRRFSELECLIWDWLKGERT